MTVRPRSPASLVAHLTSVEKYYAELFEEAPSLAGPGNLVFTGAEDDPGTLETLVQMGFADPSAVAGMVRDWHHGRMRATRSQRAREILTDLVPELLRVFGGTAAPDMALQRFDRFLARLPAGVQLFSLFHANPGLLRLVADIMAEAPLLAESLARRPGLLDAVLTVDFLAPLPSRAGLAADLGNLLAGARDFSDTLDLLRRWANERRFQIGVQLLHRSLDGAGAGAALADVAETVLSALVPAVAADFARAHGEVPGGEVAIVAMGRLGSREMTLASDLDLILIYDAPETQRGIGWSAAARGLDLLRAADPAPHRRDHGADRRGPALRGRYAAAAIGLVRADRHEPRLLRALPAPIGLDLGAHGADPRAAGSRLGADCASGSRRRSRQPSIMPRDPGAPRRRRRRDAPAHRRRAPAARPPGTCGTAAAVSSISNSSSNT